MDCDWYSFYFYFPEPSKTLFVKGLSEDTTEETLKESFDGSIRARIVTDRETGSSKGWVRGRKCAAFHLESSESSHLESSHWAPFCRLVTVEDLHEKKRQFTELALLPSVFTEAYSAVLWDILFQLSVGKCSHLGLSHLRLMGSLWNMWD